MPFSETHYQTASDLKNVDFKIRSNLLELLLLSCKTFAKVTLNFG